MTEIDLPPMYPVPDNLKIGLFTASTSAAPGGLMTWTQLGSTSEGLMAFPFDSPVKVEYYNPEDAITSVAKTYYQPPQTYPDSQATLAEDFSKALGVGLPWPSMNDTEENAAMLEAAADHIDAVGWCQNTGQNGAGNVCAVYSIGAVNRAGSYAESLRASARSNAVAGLLRDYLIQAGEVGLGVSHLPSSIPEWNDTPGRTKEDVTSAMRKAAIWIRERVTP